MKRMLFIFLFGLIYIFPVRADVYVVIYATFDGKTGHSGIALDTYQFQIRENVFNGRAVNRCDTVKTGCLTYYDFWPKGDTISRELIYKEVEPEYFKLPRGSSERKITVESLCTQGIPHKEGYPCDGLFRIKTSPEMDFRLYRYLDSAVALNKPFDARRFNCVDFVLQAVEFVTGSKLDAKEFIPNYATSTPNKFYRELKKLHGIELVKNADNKTNGLFWQERILPGLARTTERR